MTKVFDGTVKNNPLAGGERSAHLRQLEQDAKDLAELHDQAAHGEASKNPGSDLIASALERDLGRVSADIEREHQRLYGSGVPGAVLARGQSMREAVGASGPDVSLGHLVRGLGIGDWRGVPGDVKALVLSGGASAAVPGAVTAGIIDLAREQSVVFRAGAQLMPIATPTAKVARMTSAPAAEWEPEAADRDLTDGAWVFDSAELTAATAWLYTTLTVEALEDVVDLEATVMNHFSQQLGLIFDEAGIAGDGADQPVGLALMTNADDRVLELNDVGEISNFTPFVAAMGAVKARHYEPTSVLLTPAMWTELACLQDGLYNPMQPPRAYQQLQELVTGYLPDNGGVGTDEHTAIVGDLSAMTFGVRTDATLEVSRLGAGFRKGVVELRAYIRMGMYLTRPEAICVMRGITMPALPDES